MVEVYHFAEEPEYLFVSVEIVAGEGGIDGGAVIDKPPFFGVPCGVVEAFVGF